MDPTRFDRLTAQFVASRTRRGVLGTLAAFALGVAGVNRAAAVAGCRPPGDLCREDTNCCAGLCARDATGRHRCVCPAGTTAVARTCCPDANVCGAACLAAPCDAGACLVCDAATGTCASTCDAGACLTCDTATGACTSTCITGQTCTAGACCPDANVCGAACLAAPCDAGACLVCDAATGTCASTCVTGQTCTDGACVCANDDPVTCFAGGCEAGAIPSTEGCDLCVAADELPSCPGGYECSGSGECVAAFGPDWFCAYNEVGCGTPGKTGVCTHYCSASG